MKVLQPSTCTRSEYFDLSFIGEGLKIRKQTVFRVSVAALALLFFGASLGAYFYGPRFFPHFFSTQMTRNIAASVLGVIGLIFAGIFFINPSCTKKEDQKILSVSKKRDQHTYIIEGKKSLSLRKEDKYLQCVYDVEKNKFVLSAKGGYFSMNKKQTCVTFSEDSGEINKEIDASTISDFQLCLEDKCIVINKPLLLAAGQDQEGK